MKKSLSGPLSLAIDTTSRISSLAVARGNSVIGCLGIDLSDKRTERLWSEIDLLLEKVNLSLEMMDFFTVCVGPGGFTGLRVGLAATKGLVTASQKPAVGISSLAAQAYAARYSKRVLCLISAHRGDVYAQLFDFDSDRMPVPVTPPSVISAVQALDNIDTAVEFTVCVDKSFDDILITNKAGEFKGGTVNIVRGPAVVAVNLAMMGFIRYSHGETVNAEGLHACYVRPPEAETKLSLGLVGPGFGGYGKTGK